MSFSPFAQKDHEPAWMYSTFGDQQYTASRQPASAGASSPFTTGWQKTAAQTARPLRSHS